MGYIDYGRYIIHRLLFNAFSALGAEQSPGSCGNKEDINDIQSVTEESATPAVAQEQNTWIKARKCLLLNVFTIHD